MSQINIIGRTATILDPKMDPIEKVGVMARKCYKNEPKEGEDTAAVNARIIRRCIKEGHESVLEHAVYSVYLPMGVCKDSNLIYGKMLGKASENSEANHINFRATFQMHQTEAMSRYILPFVDNEMQSKHGFRTKDPKANEHDRTELPCLVGDVRAWRSMLREKMFYSIQMQPSPLEFLLTCRVAQALYEVAPIFFEDIVAQINHLFEMVKKNRDLHPMVMEQVFNRLPDDGWSIDGAIKFFFEDPDEIYAEPAASYASVSVVFKTDRATTHQLVRHRKDVAYSQESQRYVNYDKKGFCAMQLLIDPNRAGAIKVDENGIVDNGTEVFKVWREAMVFAFDRYQKLLDLGVPSESARGVLPNDTATEIGVTWLLPDGLSNLLHFRLEGHAQYSIRSAFANVLLDALANRHPFFVCLPPRQIMEWLQMLKDQNGIDQKRVAEFLGEFEARQKEIDEQNKRAFEAALRKKLEAEKDAAVTEGKTPQEPETQVPEGDSTPGVKMQ